MTAPLILSDRPDSFITQFGFSDLLLTRDVRLLLPRLLDMVMMDCRASVGAVMFVSRPGRVPIRLRLGDWSEGALEHLARWEQAVARELHRRRVYVVTFPEPTVAQLNRGAIRFLANAPLLAGAEVVGTLTIGSDAEGMPAEEILRKLRAAAFNAGVLTHVVNDLNLSYQKLSQLELFFQIGQRMVSTLDLSQLLVDTISIATSIVNASAASLLFIDEERKELIFEVAVGEKGAQLHRWRIPMDRGIAGWVAMYGEPVIVNDAPNDPRFVPDVDTKTGFLTQSILCVPLKIKGKVIGVLEVLNKFSGEGFDEGDQSLLMAVAGQAAIAIENARLYESLREERDKIISAQEEVRRELARNLHDGIAAQLTAMTWNIDYIEKLLQNKPEDIPQELDSLRQLARQASRQVRLLLFELRPVVLETRGLLAALEAYVQQLAAERNLQVHLDVLEYKGRLKPQVDGTVFSIIQEAVNNARRHAQASNVWLRVQQNFQLLRVEIEDDGVGFHLDEIERTYDERGSLGLLNMKERAQLLEGTLTIESLGEGRARGTLVRVDVPLHEAMWESLPPAHGAEVITEHREAQHDEGG